MERNIFYQVNKVSYSERCNLINQKGLVVWFTGLSGSGKSTIAVELERLLIDDNKLCYLLDGDNLRNGINLDLGFSDEDRNENIRRISEIAALFQDTGIITIVSCISPFRAMRKNARNKVPKGAFIEVYVNTPIEVCRNRDPKGLYKKNISNFTGISSLYEEPKYPEIVLDTMQYTIKQCAEQVFDFISEKVR